MLKKQTFIVLGLNALFIGSCGVASAAMTGNTINITTGVDITRTWANIVADNYAYGAKQSYNATTNKTTIWLPYGNTDGVYYAMSNVYCTNPNSSGGFGMVSSNSTTTGLATNSFFSMKFQFDKAITSFDLLTGPGFFQIEKDGEDTVVGQFLYSTDGLNWSVLYSTNVNASDVVNASITGLNTQTLYIAVSASNLTNPSDTYGGKKFWQYRQIGAANWGESGFLGYQWQLSVATAVPEPASLLALGLAGFGALAYRRK